MDWILAPWPWYVSGPFIALTMFVLLFMGKSFGMSSNLRTLCSIGGAGKRVEFFNYDWKSHKWNLVVLVGAIVGGFIAANFLSNDTLVDLSPNTLESLKELGFANAGATYLPEELFSWENVLSIKGLAIMIGGGFLVGFGARYAGGCTSGHAISGLSNLQLPSLIAVVGFFIGGMIMTRFFFPLIFQ